MNELELLQLAGKMATAAQKVIMSDVKSLSENLVKLEVAVNNYNNTIVEVLYKK